MPNIFEFTGVPPGDDVEPEAAFAKMVRGDGIAFAAKIG